MNRFEKFHYDEIKNMMIYNETLTKFKQKIIDFNINMKNAFVIKILNKLFFDFYTFFAIKNNEVRIDKKFSEFEKLMQHLERKNELKQKKIIDMTRIDQNFNDENDKNDRKNRNIRENDNRDREKNDKNDFENFKNENCINCYINHELNNNKKHCFHVNKKCRNCKKMNHIEKNCRQKKNDRYNEFEQNIKTKNSKNSKFIIFATHIDLINLNAIELIIDRLLDSSTNI